MKTEKEILETTILDRAQDINLAIEKIQNDGALLNDYVIHSDSLNFLNSPDNSDVKVILNPAGSDKQEFKIHKHALSQIATRYGIPTKYANNLNDSSWGKNLLTDIFNRTVKNSSDHRFLLREVDGQLRGFLSDKYRRLNSMQIFLAFLTAAQQQGAKLIEAHSGETRSFLEIIQPDIVEIDTPKNGLVSVVMGAQLRTSDFGNGALELNTYFMQVVCRNGMTSQKLLREIHLGKRLPDNIRFSENTYRKDTEAMASAVGDTMIQVFSPQMISSEVAKIMKASATDIDIEKSIKRLPKLGVTEAEANAANTKLLVNNPNDGVQGEATLWKLTQALTSVANDSENKERKREIQDIASAMLK